MIWWSGVIGQPRLPSMIRGNREVDMRGGNEDASMAVPAELTTHVNPSTSLGSGTPDLVAYLRIWIRAGGSGHRVMRRRRLTSSLRSVKRQLNVAAVLLQPGPTAVN